MENVADILGVQLNEEYFKVVGNEHPYRLTDKGLRNFDNGRIENDILVRLLMGDAVIVKKPWIPTVGELFCYIHTDSQGEYFIAHSYWRNDTQDKGLYALGNFFKTEEEALDNLKSYKEFVESLTPNMSWRNS